MHFALLYALLIHDVCAILLIMKACINNSLHATYKIIGTAQAQLTIPSVFRTNVETID